ncbi:HNH endonuclease [Curtobacterium sp. MCBD17_040]|uniref:HNH endonuclease n=1 Tax=Curtobacterium sp. MCBD17_040 TaxID=2175674 RepID=UPI000DA983BB|nr:HNH endonuclease [Curtobacterium sp. MCBD17_040]WIB65340.1 HNH endonuclease [Curtobacterium sp. MCBD17_040]
MRTVVVLNATYEPLTTVLVHRALMFLVSDRAVIVEAVPGASIRSASREIPLPKVVRLTKYVRVAYGHRPRAWSKRGVIERDQPFGCAYCGAKTTLTVDHIVPQSRGGRNEWNSTIGACSSCNGRKADRLPEEAGMKLRYKPRVVTERDTLRLALVKAGVDPNAYGLS